MNVIETLLEVVLVFDRVFPGSTLPDASSPILPSTR
jgi:hypothetical protein